MELEHGAAVIVSDWLRGKPEEVFYFITDESHLWEAEAFVTAAEQRGIVTKVSVLSSDEVQRGDCVEEMRRIMSYADVVIGATNYSFITTNAVDYALHHGARFLSLPLSTNDGRSMFEYDFLSMNPAAAARMAVLTALGKVRPSKSDVPSPETTRAHADRMGYKVFIPALALALTAVLVATFWTSLGANNAIGVSALVALFIAFALFKCKPSYAVSDGTRLMDNVGPVGILPQVLAALGSLFTAAGVGDVIASGVEKVIPDGSRLIAVAVYCVAMALFTIIMGNGFAAFSVITVGVGIPFLIMQGANPVVVGAMGLTAGYCGTLLTPMAANFNIMPAALLETKDKYSIIKAQAPVALTMLAIHIVLMYLLAF